MSQDIQSELEQRLAEAKAAEDRAKAEKKAAADAVRWHEKNRLRINSDALDLLLEQADDNMVRLIGNARSEAMRRLRERQSQQTDAARTAVAAKAAVEQGAASADRAGSVAPGAQAEHGEPEGGGRDDVAE